MNRLGAKIPSESSSELKMAAGGGGGRKFPAFPYEPYSIQVDFMNALYSSLDRGGVSMLESPTGTGKTLSIICSALQWLVDQKEKQKSSPSDCGRNGSSTVENDSDDEPDWIRDFVVAKNEHVGDVKMKKEKFGAGLGKPERMKNVRSQKNLTLKSVGGGDVLNVKKVENLTKDGVGDGIDDEFLLEEYQSEEEEIVRVGKPKRKVGGGVSVSSSSEDDDDQSDSEDDEGRLKVYFCSRTHSQLSQFVKELKKTPFANDMNVICLGSRKNFCINKDVLKLGSSTRINERCLELQNNKKTESSKVKSLCTGGRARCTKATSGCPMLKKHKLQRQFKDRLSQQGAMDIEDLVNLGHSIGTCPYYGSRSMASVADLVVLPYQSLLSKSSRDSLGLNLKNSVIIIDEAHNLADSLISMYDSRITISQLEDVNLHLKKYFERFHNVLGHGNRRYIQILCVITQGFLKILNEDCKDRASYTEDAAKSYRTPPSDSSMAINDFLFAFNIDNINFLKLINYIKESNIIHKVSGYGCKLLTQETEKALNSNQTAEDGSTLSSFRALADMLLSLTYKNGDGRIIISRTRTTPSGQVGGFIKYVMLTAEKIFSEVADEAHAVVLAGGTLQPVEETRERLFPWLPLDQLQFFSCNHIVPRESILPIAVSRGPTGQFFDFSYNSRSSPVMIEELGLLICNLATVIPEGIVVFFSSFDFEGQVYNAWNSAGILERINKKKRVFREPRKGNEVELILREYKETIDDASSRGCPKGSSKNGAILLAVVGGKVSEGINFSDGMGRCIVMVGLPYPNPSDIELMERIKHIDGLGDSSLPTPKFSAMDESDSGCAQTGFQVLRSCGQKGKAYYENLCMKAVNQSIGRAIRHIGDYAAILLVDKRYALNPSKQNHPHPTDKLPKWIKDSFIPSAGSYGEVHRLLHQFFKFNKK